MLTCNLGQFPNDFRACCGACPRFEIRADYGRVMPQNCGSKGDFVTRSAPRRPLSRREMLCSYPHLFFPQRFSHLVVITGEFCDSGFSPALAVMAKRREVCHSRTVLRQVWTCGPRFDIGAYSG